MWDAPMFESKAMLAVAEENKPLFERKYDGKYVYVSGNIKDINQDSISLYGSALCKIAADAKHLPYVMKKSSSVVAYGRLDYKSDNVFDLMTLRDCVLLRVPEKLAAYSQTRQGWTQDVFRHNCTNFVLGVGCVEFNQNARKVAVGLLQNSEFLDEDCSADGKQCKTFE